MQVSNPIHRPLGRRVASPLGNGAGLTLPKQNLLFYARYPNSESAVWDEEATWEENADWLYYALPVSCYAAVGTGFWFSDATTPIPRTMTEIRAGDEVNLSPGNAFASEKRGVAVYSPSPEEALERKIRKYMLNSKFEQVLIDGELLTIDGSPLYMEV